MHSIKNDPAHRIRISEILPSDRKSYLTHAILPRLSSHDYIHWLYWNARTLSSSDVVVMLKWRHHVKLYLSLFRDFWNLIFKYKQWWARKSIHYLCEGRLEKSALEITVCHHWAILVMPNGDPQDRFFYPTLTLMIDFYSWTKMHHYMEILTWEPLICTKNHLTLSILSDGRNGYLFYDIYTLSPNVDMIYREHLL